MNATPISFWSKDIISVKLCAKENKAILSIQGRLDFKRHADFREASEEALAKPEIKGIEVCLCDVDYLDSSAPGMLLMREKARNAGRRELPLSGAASLVRQVLDIANFGRLFNIH